MHIFKKKSSVSPPPDLKRVNSSTSVTSNDSNKSKNRLKSIFKSKHSTPDSYDCDLDNGISNDLDSKLQIDDKPGLIPDKYKKRVSTIVENEDLESETESEFDTDSDEQDQFSSVDEDHLHPIKPKFVPQHHELANHLSTIMGYCGLRKESSNVTDMANEESKGTYSLLDPSNRIHKLSKSNTSNQPLIDDLQIELISHLTTKIESIIDGKNLQSLMNEKSLFERYGSIRNVIGKGSYGLIKIIDPNPGTGSGETQKYTNKTLYAVKELPRRNHEASPKYIERILSEFVISSTLNSKHIVETVDLMMNSKQLTFSQVMICSQGGNLFTYLTTGLDIHNKSVSYMSLYEVDCFIKQIAKGLKYMHNHGVSHCDLKLENILISYDIDSNTKEGSKTVLKLSDFGKSFVFKTKFDQCEQMIRSGPLGSAPYIAPEEYNNDSYSSIKKDCWALGIIMLVLFNIRRHYYSRPNECKNLQDRFTEKITDSQGYGTGYLWKTTEIKSNGKEYKDKTFNEYNSKRMISNYDTKTKEWLIKRKGEFSPIENICKKEEDNDDNDDDVDDDDDELNELRIMILYKLLDIEPSTRMTVEELLKSDWMESTEACS